MKVGVLYPRSNTYPELMPGFIAGLRGAIGQEGLSEKITLINESIGFGGSEREVYEKTEKLINLEKVDFIIAYIDLKVLPLLQALLYAKDKVMMVVNAGANYPDNWVGQPNFIYLTLQHSFSSWLTGRTAANTDDKKAVLATNFYDAGYLHIAAMTERFRMDGGQIVFNYVNQDIYKDIQLTTLVEFLQKESIRNVLAVFETSLSQSFLDAMNSENVTKEKTLFVSQGMLAYSLLNNHTYQFSIQGHTTWLPAVSNISADQAKKYFTETEQTTLSFFGVQGWEAGLVVSAILRSGDYKPESICGLLPEVSFETPRGKIQFDSLTNYFKAPVYFIKKDAGQVEFEILQPGYIQEEWKSFTDHPVQGVSSGWTNTYLCY